MNKKQLALTAGLIAALPLPLLADTGSLTTLHTFQPLGQLYAGLLNVGGTLYGVDAAGGAHHAGLVFATNA
ncbi:hypothetical protein ABTK80_21250, partial [Acinetobacter baumannii]